MSHAPQYIRNVFSFWFRHVVRAAIGFFVVRTLTDTLGVDRYGAWTMVLQAMAYFSILDFGMDRALLRYIPKALAAGDHNQLRKMYSTVAALFLVIAGLTLVLVFFTQHWFASLIKSADPAIIIEARIAFAIVGLYMAARFLLYPYAGLLGAMNRFDLANLLEALEDVIRGLGIIAVIVSGYGLVAVASVLFAASLIRQLLAILLIRRMQPRPEYALSDANGNTLRELFGYGTSATGVTITWAVIFGTDVMLLGSLHSAAAAGLYAPAAQIMLMLRHLVNAISQPLTPVISFFEGAGEMPKVRDLYLRSVRYLSFVSFGGCAIVGMLAGPIVAVWLPEEFGITATLVQVLAIGTALYLPHMGGNALFFGLGRHRLLFAALAAEALIQLSLAYWLVPEGGPLGMALAVAVPQILSFLIIIPLLIGKILEIDGWRIAGAALRWGAIGGLTSTLIAGPVALFAQVDSLLALLLATGAGGITLLVVGYRWVLLPEDRSRIAGLLRRTPTA